MTLCIGQSKINKAYIGSLEINKLYSGDLTIYSKEEPVESWTIYQKSSSITEDPVYVQTPVVGQEYKESFGWGIDSSLYLYFTGGEGTRLYVRGVDRFSDEDGSYWYAESTSDKILLTLGSTQTVNCGANQADVSLISSYVLEILYH